MATNPKAELRTGVDCIGVSVVGMCHDGNGKFVLLKRSANARDEHGKWDMCAGALDFGNTLEDQIRQEVKEELGAQVLAMQYLGYRDAFRSQNNQPTHWVGHDFLVQVNPADVRIGEPHKFTEIGWFAVGSFPEEKLLHSQIPIALKRYKDKLTE